MLLAFLRTTYYYTVSIYGVAGRCNKRCRNAGCGRDRSGRHPPPYRPDTDCMDGSIPTRRQQKKKASFRSIDSICMLPFYCSNLSARTPSICIFSFFKLKIYIQLNQEAWAAAPIFSHLAPLMRFWKLS